MEEKGGRGSAAAGAAAAAAAAVAVGEVICLLLEPCEQANERRVILGVGCLA